MKNIDYIFDIDFDQLEYYSTYGRDVPEKCFGMVKLKSIGKASLDNLLKDYGKEPSQEIKEFLRFVLTNSWKKANSYSYEYKHRAVMSKPSYKGDFIPLLIYWLRDEKFKNDEIFAFLIERTVSHLKNLAA